MNPQRPSVRRPCTEWGLFFCLLISLSSLALWIASLQPGWPSPCIELASDVWDGGGVYLQLLQGDVWLYRFPGSDGTSFIPPDLSQIPASGRVGSGTFQRHSLTLPGLEVHSVIYSSTPYPEWSIRISLVIPAAISFLAAALLLRRLQKHNYVAP